MTTTKNDIEIGQKVKVFGLYSDAKKIRVGFVEAPVNEPPGCVRVRLQDGSVVAVNRRDVIAC